MYLYYDRVFVDTQLNGPFTLSTYKHWLKVQESLEKTLKSKGITRYYALVDSYLKFRWCEFVGMRSNLEVFDDVIEVMVKDI